MSNSLDSLAVETATPASAGVATAAGGPLGRLVGMRWGDDLGVAPCLIFAVMFLIIPTLYLVIGAFQANDGSFTLQNIHNLSTPQILSSFWISIRVSTASAFFGSVIGLVLALAVIRGRLPEAIRATELPFTGVASNFAGIPL